MIVTPRTSLPVVAVVLCAACGAGQPEAASAGSGTTAAAPQAAASRPAKNACALVPRQQLETIAKDKLNMLHNIEQEDKTVCELTSASTNTLAVAVTVYWRQGKELARTNQAAMSMARQMLSDDDADLLEVTGSEKVRGLADKAFYSDVMPSWFLKGDVLVEVISPRFGHDQTKAVFVAVAKEALPRLP